MGGGGGVGRGRLSGSKFDDTPGDFVEHLASAPIVVEFIDIGRYSYRKKYSKASIFFL